MSNFNQATARPVSSAWEAMEREYDSRMFQAAREGLFGQDLDEVTVSSTRAKVRAEEIEFMKELAAMGYNRRRGNSKSKQTMIRKRGRV